MYMFWIYKYCCLINLLHYKFPYLTKGISPALQTIKIVMYMFWIYKKITSECFKTDCGHKFMDRN